MSSFDDNVNDSVVGRIFEEPLDEDLIDLKNIQDEDELFQYLDCCFIPEYRCYKNVFDSFLGDYKYVSFINKKDILNLNLSEEYTDLTINYLRELGICVEYPEYLEDALSDDVKEKRRLLKGCIDKQLLMFLFDKYNLTKEQLVVCDDLEEKKRLVKDLIDLRNQIFLTTKEAIDFYVMKFYGDGKLPVEDIKQLSYQLFLENFIDNFDVKKITLFVTYLYKFIKRCVGSTLEKQKYFYVTKTQMDKINKILAVKEKFEKINGYVTHQDIAKELNMAVEDVIELMVISQLDTVDSLTDYEGDWLLGEDEYEDALDDVDYDSSKTLDSTLIEYIDFDRSLDNEILRMSIEESLEILPSKEAEILRFRFGLDGGRTKSYEEVAKKFNLSSRQLAKDIERRALNKIRYFSSRKLTGYLDGKKVL